MKLLLITSFTFLTVFGVTCQPNQFKNPEQIAITCAPASNQQQAVSLPPQQDVMITHFPAGTKNAVIELSSSEGDLDVCLFDAVHNSCVHGALNCVAGYGCRVARVNNVANPVTYAGVQLSFTGDQTQPPTVSETLRLTGTLTSDMWLKVLAYSPFNGAPGNYNGMITWSHDGIAGACNPDDHDTCVPCDNYDCSATPGSHPKCDGSATVQCITCPTGQSWDAQAQQCKTDAPFCIGVTRLGTPQRWSISNTKILNDFGVPQDGCCQDAPDAAETGSFCKSTGDPHILQFNGHTNHAYINGDYWMYQGNQLSVALRHVRHGSVAGNNAFSISGPMLDGHKLEFYDRDTVTQVNHNRPEPKVYIDGVEILSDTATTKYQKACDFFLERNLVCSCSWSGTVFHFMINDKTNFKFDRWTRGGRGWNNAFLQINPADMDPTDIGMCTYDATSNNEAEAGKFRENPYPLARISCDGHLTGSEDPFTLTEGYTQTNALRSNYFCLPASEMDRRRFAETRRRTVQQELQTCKGQQLQMFTVAYQICSVCQGLGSDRVMTCLWDACMMGDAEMAVGEANGCTEEIIMRTPPAERNTKCPAGTDWDEALQSCMGDYDVRRASTCIGTQPSPQTLYLKNCHEACQTNSACSAYTFDVYKNECIIWPTCTQTTAAAAQFTTYVKDRSGEPVLARGSSFDGGAGNTGSSGPQATYGHGGSMGSSGTVPDFNDVHSNIDDVHENVDEVHDNIDEMRLLLQQLGGSSNTLEDDLDDVHDAVQELRSILAAMQTNGGAAPQNPTNTQTQYNPQMNPQMNPNGMYGAPTGYNPYAQGNPYSQPQNTNAPQTNDDWKTVGIVSAVMSFVLLIGGVIAVSVYFCCMKRD